MTHPPPDPQSALVTPREFDRQEGFGAAQVHLRPRKSLPFFARHPWVYESAVERLEGEPRDGDVVDLISDKGKFIARGLYNSRSRLRVRLYTWEAGVPLDAAFFERRLAAAIAFRREQGGLEPGRAARLVYSEGDGISGLIVDAYDGHLVVQLNALAMALRWEDLRASLVRLLQPASILVRSEKGIAREEGISREEGDGDREPGAEPEAQPSRQPAGPLFVQEHGLRFGVDLQTGQKTGFYLDQVENRRAFARYVKDRRVLDLFCYTGAFSLVAAVLGHAREVLGIDSSERAVALARANAELNGTTNVRFRTQDCFEALDELQAQGARFGAIVLDPPKFTRSRQSLDEALRAYFRINRVALELLEPGGILATCSCSGNVSPADFRGMLAVVAQKSGRQVQILEQRGAAPDHPVSATCPETEYLKCLICRVA